MQAEPQTHPHGRFVNDAPHIPTDPNSPGRTEATINCSLCTAAAIVMHGTGNFCSSGQVATELAGGLPTAQGNSNFCKEIQAQAAIAAAQQHRADRRKGGHILNGANGTEFQAANKMTTKDVMSAAGNIDTINTGTINGMLHYCKEKLGNGIILHKDPISLPTALSRMSDYPEGTMFGVLLPKDGHWNYAHVVPMDNGKRKVQFIDYQTEHANMKGAGSVANVPVMGITGELLFDEKTTVSVLAFSPCNGAEKNGENPMVVPPTYTPRKNAERRKAVDFGKL
jgi:hypothetical protein